MVQYSYVIIVNGKFYVMSNHVVDGELEWPWKVTTANFLMAVTF